MKRYLMGRSDDHLDDGIYPIVTVENITKDDLVRCKRDDLFIINLVETTFYDYRKNKWGHLKEFEKYSDQWKESAN